MIKLSLNKEQIKNIMKIKCNLCSKTFDVAENLTDKQLKILKFIVEYRKKHSKCPAIREIMGGLGYKSTSPVFMLIEALILKKYLAKQPYKKRNLIILKDVVCA